MYDKHSLEVEKFAIEEHKLARKSVYFEKKRYICVFI